MTSRNGVKFSRVWAMPNKWTFKMGPLVEVVRHYMQQADGVWLDPFAGQHSPCHFKYTNDLHPEMPTKHHLEAEHFLTLMQERLHGEKVAGIVFDPPYSLTQVSRSYQGMGMKFKAKENPTGGFPKAKDIIRRIVMPGGFVVSFGWNTIGMGKERGFEPVEYVICSHGGNRNDTLVVVERRV